jgi:predicted GH43/DUF377 family glycosyl hydrolase
MKITKKNIRLYASPRAVITQFLHLPGNERVKHVVDKIELMDDETALTCLEKVRKDFENRHRSIDNIFLENLEKIRMQLPQKDFNLLTAEKRLLAGAYFTKEYSIQAAALFNPSIVPHPDQSGLHPGQQRFVLSMRATGEGHISSVVFKTGVVTKSNDIIFDNPAEVYSPLSKNKSTAFERAFFEKRCSFFHGFKKELLNLLPEKFTEGEALKLIEASALFTDGSYANSIQIFKAICDSNYELTSSASMPLDEKVIFPISKAESMGIEDVRWVRFTGANTPVYYGTYTAYNGHEIKSQLIITEDFVSFKIRTLYGKAISDKGMALFPEKINGRYAMISRQGGEKIQIMFSDDLFVWNDFQTLMEPEFPWELVQLGNCGSPIKTEKGWLLLTHGVGAMRTYVISAILLDLENPSLIIGRLDRPLISAEENDREGYVPNVVYTCGFLQNDTSLLIPYALSDSATAFATVQINELLSELIKND